MNNSEPINIGRKSRIWPSAMARAIKERDQHCAWPGCTHAHHLHIHHIKHWADGGETSVRNGVCLCSYHHTLVHEGGYTIEHVDGSDYRQHEQFVQQQHDSDNGMFDFEKKLRNDKASFNNVRRLSPTRYRYQILNAKGRNMLVRSSAQSVNQVCDSTRVYLIEDQYAANIGSTPVDCNEPLLVMSSGSYAYGRSGVLI